MEIPEGDHKPFKIEDLEEENLFHEAGTTDQVARDGLKPNYDEYDKINDPQGESIYDLYDEEVEEVDVFLSQGESLMVQKVMSTTIEKEEDWGTCSIFQTHAGCDKKEKAKSKAIGFFSSKLKGNFV